MMNKIDELLTPKEVSEVLKVNVNTVYIWLREEKIKSVRVGDLWRVRRSDLDDFINAKQNT